MMFDRYQYVVVEGPIGVGKTSLANRLAEHFSTDTLLEKPDENPFLPSFYRNPQHYALATQLFFLFQRSSEVRELAKQGIPQAGIVSDYLLDKDPLFAQINLSEEEFSLYQQAASALKFRSPPPDLVIYLQSDPDTLIERVRRRANDYEQSITDDYLRQLALGYRELFHHYHDAPVLTVNSENLNFADSEDDFKLLLQHIQDMRGMRGFLSRGA